MHEDPIAALDSVLLAAQMARFEALSGDADRVKTLARGTRSGDGAGFRRAYAEAVRLAEALLAQQARHEGDRAQEHLSRSERQRSQSALAVAEQALSRLSGEWPARLERLREQLHEKATKDLARLPVQQRERAETGETVFSVEAAALAAFSAWLAETLAAHAADQAERVQRDIQAVIDATGARSFETAPPSLRAGRASLRTLEGYAAPTPGRLDGLSRASRVALGASPVLGFLTINSSKALSLTEDRATQEAWSHYVTMASLALLVLAIVYAVMTVPGELRQRRQKLAQDARKVVQKELSAAIDELLRKEAREHERQLKKHFEAEKERLRRGLGGPAGPETSPLASTALGLPTKTQEQLRGEWLPALRARLAELKAGATAG